MWESNTTSNLPTTQCAIVQDEQGKPQLNNNVPLPALLPGAVLVKPAAVALNPSDHKMGTAFPTPGAVVGMDFAGTIVAVHPMTTTELRIGDRVAGMVHGSNPTTPDNGAFAEYIRATPELLLRVPPSLSFQEAATFGTALSTNLLALWDPAALNLAATPESPATISAPVLVYGGSTATGTVAVQLLRLSGLDPIATCSPRNAELVRGCGASAIFDYSKPNVAEEIKKHTGGRLAYAYDCIADVDSVAHCYAALGRSGTRYAHLELVPPERKTRRAVRAELIMGYDVFGADVPLSGGYERSADQKKRDLAVHYFKIFQRLLDAGKLRPHPTQTLEGGLQGVLQGLQMLKSGQVSGKKLVVPV